MACQVGDGTDGIEEVTFLYRLTPGPCPKSYGVNVARLAGVFVYFPLFGVWSSYSCFQKFIEALYCPEEYLVTPSDCICKI